MMAKVMDPRKTSCGRSDTTLAKQTLDVLRKSHPRVHPATVAAPE